MPSYILGSERLLIPDSVRTSLSHPLLLLGALGLTACLDLGDPAPDAAAPDAAPDAAVGVDTAGFPDAGGPCVEGPVSTETAADVTIRIQSFALDQPAVTLPVGGGVVRWRNTDGMAHQLVAGAPGAPIALAEGGFDSGELRRNDTYAHRFCAARTLIYFCATHPGGMNGYRLAIP